MFAFVCDNKYSRSLERDLLHSVSVSVSFFLSCSLSFSIRRYISLIFSLLFLCKKDFDDQTRARDVLIVWSEVALFLSVSLDCSPILFYRHTSKSSFARRILSRTKNDVFVFAASRFSEALYHLSVALFGYPLVYALFRCLFPFTRYHVYLRDTHLLPYSLKGHENGEVFGRRKKNRSEKLRMT